jgi:hypothetical protein
MKGTLEVERLSVWAICEGNLVGGEGDYFTGDPGGYVEKALEKRICLHRGSAGEPGGGLVYRGL